MSNLNFVTFIDDYSRFTWLFLMKYRSELFSIFYSFYNEIKNQYGVFFFKLCIVIMLVGMFLILLKNL